MARIKILIITIATGMLFASCSNTKKLPEKESLFLGSKVNIKDDYATKREKKVLTGDLAGAVRPKPNTKVLGMRLKLAAYNSVDTPKKPKGLKHFIKNKFGEPPVLTSSVDLEKNRQILSNILENRGFFYPVVTPSISTKNKKSTAHFDVVTGPQYKIRNVEFVTDTSQISRDIAAQSTETLLKPDVPFNLDLMKGERLRIDRKLNEMGYYYFVPDDIIIQVDSTVGDHKVDLHVKVKDQVPDDAKAIYRIDDVFIFPNYRLGANRIRNSKPDTSTATSRRRRGVVTAMKRDNDTLLYEDHFHIVGNTRMFKPKVFTQAMRFEPGDTYNRTDHNVSLNRLINMGTFKFVKNEFEPTEPGLLNAYYYLTPNPKKSLQAELGGYTKNDSRVGSQLSVSWRNRNALRGAELLTVKAGVGFESQPGGGINRPNTYQFLLEPRISIPRFVVPFFNIKSSSMFVPRTSIYTGYELISRAPLYRLHSFKAGYGYNWKEDVRREHELFPININYVITDTLNKDTSFYLSYGNLLFNGLIIGPTYNFTYNSRGDGPPNRQDFFFNGLVDLSGNILGLAQGSKQGDEKTIFGERYAQYLKFQTDFRYYINYGANPNSIWANRLILGYGHPHGNSTQLPNIKQFFSGGNSSLRGFRSRYVGPGGSYNYIGDSKTQKFIETAGDIKLELNTELRAQLFSFLHGAIFVDAGNVWTARDTTVFGELARFKPERILSQLAVDAGAGLRFDFKIIVLRLDFGIPVRKPWADNPNAFNKEPFKTEDIIFNLAIGYPF